MLGRRQRQDADLPWHPDFRDTASLPDVRPVRLSAALNIVAAACLLAALLYAGRQEFEIQTLKADQDRWRETAEEDRARNNEILVEGRAFDAAAAKVEEVHTFVAGGMDAAALVLAAAGEVGRDVQLTNLALSPAAMTVRGTVAGAVADAAVVADAFAKRLGTVETLAARFPRVELEQVSPIGGQEGVSFVIQLRPPVAAPAAPARPPAASNTGDTP
jgi:hypothetical protein